jgi:hypothetical protein
VSRGAFQSHNNAFDQLALVIKACFNAKKYPGVAPATVFFCDLEQQIFAITFLKVLLLQSQQL